MLRGRGGNVGISTGEDGLYIIDDQVRPITDQLLQAIANISDEPVRFVINTHYHGDHSGGNEAMGERGSFIVAHENVRRRLVEDLNEKTVLTVVTVSRETLNDLLPQTFQAPTTNVTP